MANNHLTPRKFLAKELQRLREAKGIKRPHVAKVLFVSEELVRSWEKGRRLPQPDHLAKLEELYGTAGTLTELREDLITAAVPLEWFGRWPEIEKQATSLWWFEPSVFPGLLQTEDYARAILRAANLIADLDEMVVARMERQQILHKEDPPVLVALISESVLRHNVGGAEVMYEQLLHLAKMAERDNIIVHIVPDNAPACAGFLSGFIIASFDGGDDIGYVDNQLYGDTVETAEEVTRLRRFFDVFRGDALSRQASVDLIRKVAEQWKAEL
jgi:transcriptional regulator with XRE-family HTH domain